ncbi:ArsR/SmtB family transcription factor [Arthrobacter bussei]|uniref:Winged helix-turn-helix transcriptional regulator n=1 Tax=Arthrobacter bussei TaxID=2594179 RepID=A0A7X1NNR6_9MICC|nr:metalloregulator ArsR/SmtB family transcription factor [Arthrobacter bussei]MPY10070.1 winged helix-turn-helix transcriptional regulator [Arthrobacter bussei]
MGIDDVFAVIAESTRRQILEHLRDGDKAVGELVVELHVSQPTVSKHLKVLREAGLVSMRAQGQKRFYSLDTAPLGLVREWLDGVEPRPLAEAEAEAPTVEDLVEALGTQPGQGRAGEGQAQDAVLAAAVLAGPDPLAEADGSRAQLGRTMGRAAERAADLLSQLRRRRDPSS